MKVKAETRGKRQEARGKRQEARGKRQEDVDLSRLYVKCGSWFL
jgi:uncharacterized protein YjbJ (UPF0337 family)